MGKEITEIHKLHKMLSDAGIKHKWLDRGKQFDPRGELKLCGVDHDWGWQILILDSDGDRIISVIEGYGTYGVEDDLLEIMGLLTPEEGECDSVCGWLTAENVFARIQQHLEGK